MNAPFNHDKHRAQLESLLLPCALRAGDSGGRAHPETEHPYRTCYQRDRDRIVHCSAFRRLDYKTQVFVPHEQDHHRTRLTHSLEVAQIARTLCRALCLNEDAAEAGALAHDLGHPPFGHAGEDALNDLMAEAGGFEHNRQTLRVVDYLEHPYPDFRGLNLTNAVRLCLAKHETPYDSPQKGGQATFFGPLSEGRTSSLEKSCLSPFLPFAPLEGQLVDLADEIAYTSADMSDALSAGWISTEQLDGLELWRQAWRRAEEAMPDARDIHKRICACRSVLGILADDLLTETTGRIERLKPSSPNDVQNAPQRCAAFSDKAAERLEELQQFLLENVYRHPEALRHHAEACQIITGLFRAYLAQPALLPKRYRSRIDADGFHRVVCDYIAGMTDRFCRQEHTRVKK